MATMMNGVRLLCLLITSALGSVPSSNHLRNSYFPASTHRFNYLNSSVSDHSRYSSHQYSIHNSRLVNPSRNPSTSTYGTQSGQLVAKGRPTVRPARFFSPQQDAQNLRNALQGFSKPDVIIGILTNRSNNQRQIIMQYYPALKSDLQRKLSFDFRDLMEVLVTPIQTYLSQHLKQALKFSTSIDEKLLVEILSTLNNTQLRIVKDEYRKMYGRSLHDDMTSFSLNKFTNFFSFYIEGARDENPWVDHALATKDAERLITSGKLSIESGSFFRSILGIRSFDQLNRTFYEYQRLKHENIEHTIKRDLAGSVRYSVLQVVKSILNRGNYFAEILHEDMGSLSKKVSTLIRIIVERAEIDMGDVKDSYARLYRTSLEKEISINTSGDFKKALLALISG